MKIKNISLFAIVFLLSSKAVSAGYGYSPVVNLAPSCGNQAPSKPTITYVQNVSKSEFKIGWDGARNASSWTVAYGKNPSQYIYGITNFGDSRSRAVNISMLPAGTYYVAIKANNGCMPGSFSAEQKVVVDGNGKVTSSRIANRRTIIQKIKQVVAPTPTVEATSTITPEPTKSEVSPSIPTTKKEGFFKRIFNAIFN